MRYLEETFESLLREYSIDNAVIQILWDDIVNAYSEAGRHYHNIFHLGHLLKELVRVKYEIKNWNGILFALFYHDYIYQTKIDSKNEEESAAYAANLLTRLRLGQSLVDFVRNTINATASHEMLDSADIALFLDADLSILGADRKAYQTYAFNIRKEYIQFDENAYTQGRISVLNTFLSKPSIFQTEKFSNLYEVRAGENIQWEINQLSNGAFFSTE